MGRVYLARQTQPVQRQVALKVVKPGMDSKQVIARFEAERQALALLDHPNIAQVYDAGSTEDGHPYFSMEYIDGLSITDHCDQYRLTVEERLQLFAQVCDGVQHAHHKGIIHRDIKPSNVLVCSEDHRPLPKIIDFGVAKALTAPLTERTLFTEQGQLLGTAEYMSPEQAQLAGGDIDTRSDVYSLGVLLYELLTGTPPFLRTDLQKAGLAEILRVIREEEPPSPSTRLSNLGGKAKEVADKRRTQIKVLAKRLWSELQWIPLRAMAKEPERRYETPRALADDVERYLKGEPISARPPSSIYRLRKLLRRHRHRAIVAACVAIAVTLTTIVTILSIPDELDLMHRRIADNPQSAERYIERARLYFRRHKTDRGLRDLDTAAQLLKERWNVARMYREFAWLFLCGPEKYQDYELGLRLAQEMTLWEPEWPSSGWPTHNTLAMAYYRMGRWNDAIKSLNASRQCQWGGNGHTYVLLSMCEYRKGNEKAAKQWFNRAVEWITNADWGVLDHQGLPYLRNPYQEATELMHIKPKKFYRKGLCLGEVVATITARPADQSHTDATLGRILDGSGLGDDDCDGLTEHNDDPDGMWRTRSNGAEDGIEFNLGAMYALGTILVWNYNERGRTKQGVGRADISVWTEDAGWQRLHRDLEFAEAEGSFDYDEPIIIEFDGVRAQKVRFDNLVNLGDAEFIGLSEVQFFEDRERASRPHPVDGGTLENWTTPTLGWVPGDDAARHRVYFGNDPEDLQFLAELESNEFNDIASLEKRRWYYWRVDTEKTDGSIAEGEVWRFSTGHLVAWYQFDKSEGDVAPDSSDSHLSGRLMGDASLVADQERGNVLRLDGNGDYVDCGNDGRFDIASELTLAAWIKTGQYERQCHAVITKSDRSWRLEKDAVRPEISFGAWNLNVDTDVACCSEIPLDDGVWHHIVGTYDGARMAFYTDGHADISVRATGTVGVSRWKVMIGENAMWSGRGWNGQESEAPGEE